MFRIDSAGSIAVAPVPSSLATEGYFTEGNPALAQPATRVSQDFMNAVQESLIAFLTAANMAHSKSDYSRVWQAIGRSITFQDVGSANAVAITLPAGLTFPSGSIGLGTTFRVKLAASFTASASFAPFELSATPILRSDGTPAGKGDGLIGSIIELVNDGSGHWQILAGGSAPLIALVSPTIYVRTDGNDANDGSANSSAKALLTIAAAFNLAKRYYTPGGQVTIQLGNPGTYAAASPPPMGTPVVVQGDTANPTNYLITGPGTGTAVIYAAGANLAFDGVQLNNSANTFSLVAAAYGGIVTFSHTRFSATGTGNTQPAVRTFAGGIITFGPGVSVGANFGYLLFAGDGSVTVQSGATVTAVGGPAFSAFTVFASDGGKISLGGSTWSGAATGQRYGVITNGVIDTQAAGASFIFGSSPGSTDGFGVYI